MTRRIWFAGGGTGGHLYPGLAIARALSRQTPGYSPFFIGAHRGVERIVLPKTEFPHVLLDLHPLYRQAWWKNWRTIVGAVSAWRTLSKLAKEAPPHAVVGTGGYAAGVALAWARAHGIPTILHEPDSHPGITTRAFAKGASAVYLGFQEALNHLTVSPQADVRNFGAPIEPPPAQRPSPEAARIAWGFPGDAFVVLVVGGSQGARALNDVVAEWCGKGLPSGVAVIWATGEAHAGTYDHLESPMVRIRAYLSPIADAYGATDVCLARAGAMTIAELCAWGIASVLVPLPTSAQNHQMHNAIAVSAHGAAIHLPQSELSVERLESITQDFRIHPYKLETMRSVALERARPTAAKDIVDAMIELFRS